MLTMLASNVGWAACVVAGAILLHQLVMKRECVRRPPPIPSNSVVLITGGGSGIGLEIARNFVLSGCAHTILVGRTESTLLDAKQSLLQLRASTMGQGSKTASTTSPFVTTVVCDVTRASDVQSLVAAVTSTIASCNAASQGHHHLSHVVLNAGSGAIMKFAGSDWAEYEVVARHVMELNYFANVRILHNLLPLMIPPGGGCVAAPSRVLVVSSLAGVLPSTLRSAYTASKHAMQGFINALRGEFTSDAVTFTTACPGYVETPFHAKAATAGGWASTGVGSTSAHGHRKHAMSAQECARICVAACVQGKSEVIMTWSGWLAYCLRPLLPRTIDRLAAKKSYASVGLQGP